MKKLVLLATIFLAMAVVFNPPATDAGAQTKNEKTTAKKGKGGGKVKSEIAKSDMVHIKSKNMDFWMDEYEATQEDFKKVMGNNPSYFKDCGNKCPVESVTWKEAAEYCKKISKRLPTEQEWEEAAKGGREVKYATGNGELACTNANWGRYGSNRKCVGYEGPVPVASYAPNALSLYDMTGNVSEWTSTPHERYGFVLRGGGWGANNPVNLTVFYRYFNDPGSRNPTHGFRCAQ